MGEGRTGAEDMMSNNPFEDSYHTGDCIIPPRSIVDGTTPLGVFLDYINTVDLSKVRLCDAISIYYWLGRYIDTIPESIRRQHEEAMHDQWRSSGE